MSKHKIISNSLALVINRLTQSITTFVLLAIVARSLGPYILGQYTLAFSYYFLFVSIASTGLKTLFTREISRNLASTPTYLVSGSFLQLIYSLISYLGLVIIVHALPYNSDTSFICYVMGLMILPFSLSNVTEAILQAHEKMHLIAISTAPVYLLRLCAIIWCLNLGYKLNVLVILLIISEFLIWLIEWILVTRCTKPQWTIHWDFMWSSIQASRTFLVIESIAVLNIRMQIFILSVLSSEVAVGLYGAVMQLMQPLLIISTSLVLALFPQISKAAPFDVKRQRKLTEGMIEILLILSAAFVLGMFFLGGDVLLLLYGNPSFASAASVLNILSLTLILSAFSLPISYALVANNFEKINLREVILQTFLGVPLSIIAISSLHLNGAATATLTVRIISCSIYFFAMSQHLFKLRWTVILRPLFVAVYMLSILTILRLLHQSLLTTLIATSVAFTLFVTLLAIRELGGWKVVWRSLRQKKV
jgi:O-antigen/teichoic acid export membrane protein